MSDFTGFEASNTTPVPDVLFDILLSELSGAELKVLLYIIRRTKGFKKDTDAISLSQLQKGIVTRDGRRLDSGCGIKRRDTIVEALASLEEKKCITSQKKQTSKKDHATTIYGICFKENGVVTKPDYPPSHQTGLPLVTKADQGSHQSEPPVVTKPDPQETVIQQTDSQETVIQESNTDVASQTSTPTSLSPQEISEEQGHAWAEAHGYVLAPNPDVNKIPLTFTPTAEIESPQSDASSNTSPQSVAENNTPKPSRTARKPKAPKVAISDEDNKRIDTFLECMDRAARSALEEETKEPSDFSFTRTKKDRGIIHEFLNGRVISEKQVKLVYSCMWKSPPGKDGFQWRNNISIAAFCRNYDTMLLKAMSAPSGKEQADDRSEEAISRAKKNNQAQLEKMLARKAKLQKEKEERQNGTKNIGTPKEASHMGMRQG